MLTLYTRRTPNGRKVSIMLEECAVPYTVEPISFEAKEHQTPEFLKINPNGKIPALVDSEGPDGQPWTVFESGAILWYLGEKFGTLMPSTKSGRDLAHQWLVFASASFGPMLGQAHHFRVFGPEKVPYAIDRFTQEATRLYNVVDKRLQSEPFLAGTYSVADLAVYPWIERHEYQGQSLSDYPALQRWFDTLSQRPAVIRGMAIPEVAA